MAVGSDVFPELAPVAGVRLACTSAGIKMPGRTDLVLVELSQQSNVAAVFTRNAFCAAPVTVARRHMAEVRPRMLLINTGNANAGTGERGIADALQCCAALADSAKLQIQQILPFSTGVIGEPLPVDVIRAAIPALPSHLSSAGWAEAASAILTTDTRPKGASRRIVLSSGEVTITGIAKGAGMIKPNMATMLSYVATDAAVDRDQLQGLLERAVTRSFNRITVDGDTSTNDAAVLIASGESAVSPGESDADWSIFADAVCEVFIELAQAIVKDGEGASKFVAVEVTAGASTQECLAVAYAVAESPLVKTALFASDANWGRILAAVGRSGLERLDVNRVRIWINQVLVAEKGARAADYSEASGAEAMARDQIHIVIDLGRGKHTETVWTTDLSHEYIRINAEYRT